MSSTLHPITPALVVDLDRLDHNLNLMAGYFASRPAKLRPHFKSHKCVTLARRQIAAGAAVGITCAKLAEAEILVAGGIDDVLIANQVVGPEKALRLAKLNGRSAGLQAGLNSTSEKAVSLAKLNRQAMVRCAVDSQEVVKQIGAAASELGVTIGVLVEIDVGMRRCGVAPGQTALALAAAISKTKGVRFDGLQAYEGHVVTTPDFEERNRKVLEAMEPVLETKKLIESSGIPCPTISGGGTGTYAITGNIPGFTEIQAGSYALLDCSYKKVTPEFQNALYILSTIVSASADYAVADVGLKGMGNEFGMPVLMDFPDARSRSLAEEHLPVDGIKASVGDQVRIIPSHGCTTCNLHRKLWIKRGETIEGTWPIEASGALE